MTETSEMNGAMALMLYFAPAILAGLRQHSQRAAIAALNLLLGWTILGWIGAFVWACTRSFEPRDDPAAAKR